jgi:hypothetical protein
MSGGDAVRRPFAKLYCYTQKRQSTQQRNLSLSDCEELLFAVLDLSTRKQSDKETFHPCLVSACPSLYRLDIDQSQNLLVYFCITLWCYCSMMFGGQQGGQRTNNEMILLSTKILSVFALEQGRCPALLPFDVLLSLNNQFKCK